MILIPPPPVAHSGMFTSATFGPNSVDSAKRSPTPGQFWQMSVDVDKQ